MREELVARVMACSWTELQPHHERGALLLVAPELDLVEVAEAVSLDHSGPVKRWLAEGRVARPAAHHVLDWEERPSRFQFLIVQPFVLAQELDATG